MREMWQGDGTFVLLWPYNSEAKGWLWVNNDWVNMFGILAGVATGVGIHIVFRCVIALNT